MTIALFETLNERFGFSLFSYCSQLSLKRMKVTIMVRKLSILLKAFRGFIQFLQVNSNTVPLDRPSILSPHHSPTSSQLDSSTYPSQLIHINKIMVMILF
jgi:hypothetical protein